MTVYDRRPLVAPGNYTLTDHRYSGSIEPPHCRQSRNQSSSVGPIDRQNSRSKFGVGFNETYTITVTNVGLFSTTNQITVTDNLPVD